MADAVKKKPVGKASNLWFVVNHSLLSSYYKAGPLHALFFKGWILLATHHRNCFYFFLCPWQFYRLFLEGFRH